MEQEQQMRFSSEELEVIRSHFKGNEALLKLMRKVFLPTFDPKAPIGQTIDLWMTINLENMSDEEAMRRIRARNEVIMHVESQLMQLRNLSEMQSETKEELEKRNKQDSTK